MIKGKTTIELFNAETGALEASYEDENLVTNAVAYLMNIEAASGESLNTNVFPLATMALGGLLLFDGELEESADNVHFPTKDVHLVAYASTNVNASDPNRGSFNSLESGARDGGYVSVWDFGTSQANGIIKSAARTHQWSAQDPIRYYEGAAGRTTRSGNPSNDTYWYPIRYDGEYLYMLKYNGSNHEMREYRVRKPMLRMKVADYSGRVEEYEPVSTFDTTACQFEYISDSSGGTRTVTFYADSPKYYFDGNDGFYYCCYAGYDATKESGFVFNWFTINYGDGSYKKSELHQITLQAKAYCNVSSYSEYDKTQKKYITRYANYMAGASVVRINNGYMYLIASSRKSILRINLKNPADQVSIKVIEDGSSDYIVDLQQINLRNGGVFFTIYHYTTDGYQYRNGLMYQDGTVFLHNFAGTNNNSDWYNDVLVNGAELERFGYYSDLSVRRGFIANYLGTINNLTSPIEKNASQTMKVTYTLTDVDESTASSDEEVTG